MAPSSDDEFRDFPRGRRIAGGSSQGADGTWPGDSPAAPPSTEPLTSIERLRGAQGIAAPTARPTTDDGRRPRTGERTLPLGSTDAEPAAAPAPAPPAEPYADPVASAAPSGEPYAPAEPPAPGRRADRPPGWRARRGTSEEAVDPVAVEPPPSPSDVAAWAASIADEVAQSAVAPSRAPLNPVPEVVVPTPEVAAELAELTPDAPAQVEETAEVVAPEPAVAERPARRARREEAPPRADLDQFTTSLPRVTVDESAGSRSMPAGLAAFGLLVLAGTVALVLAVLSLGPAWVDGVGSVAVVTGFAGLLGVRTNGHPWLSAGVAAVLGTGAVVSAQPAVMTGAAVLTAVVGGVYAVMATVPAVTFLAAAREVLLATLLSVVVALAVVGFEPTANVEAFEITTLLLAVAVVMALVYRLGAGLHGLGRRGTIVIGVGFALLACAIVYAELLRRYGAPGIVASVLDVVDWSRAHVYAFPRPLVVVLGIPALAWGAHLRARRRQGWWVAAFGVAATVPVATSLIGVDASLLGALVRASYSLVCGLVLAWLVVWLDLRLTGPRGAGARRVEEASAHRPEPSRWQPL